MTCDIWGEAEDDEGAEEVVAMERVLSVLELSALASSVLELTTCQQEWLDTSKAEHTVYERLVQGERPKR